MKAVIFDMDGLMFDTEAVFAEAWDWVGEQVGIGKAGFMVMETLGMNVELTKQKWRERFGSQCSEEEVTRLTHEYIDGFYAANQVPVKKGLHNLLAYLKKAGFRMAVASSSPMEDIERNLCGAGVGAYFSAVVSGDQVENSKPAPDIYLKACEQLSAEPEECYALEDSPSGLRAAMAAGCVTVHVPDLWQPDDATRAKVAAVCGDLDEVIDFIRRSAAKFTYTPVPLPVH